MAGNYHFEIGGKVVAIKKEKFGDIPMLKVLLDVGTDKYPNQVPIAYYKDDAVRLAGELQAGMDVVCAGYVKGQRSQKTGAIFTNLNGKDITIKPSAAASGDWGDDHQDSWGATKPASPPTLDSQPDIGDIPF